MPTEIQGLNIPIGGEPEQMILQGNSVSRVAVVGRDFIGLKPSMKVQVGDRVVLGQPLFSDRRNPGVHYVAPGSGSIIEINRGERRILQSIVIDLDAPSDTSSAESFNSYTAEELANLGSAQVREDLIASGHWVGFRTRPFSKVPGAAYHGDWGGRVEEFMSREVKTVDADGSIVDVAETFVEMGYRRLPVVERNRLVGQISRHDILKAMEILH